jgi:uncharacterized protein
MPIKKGAFQIFVKPSGALCNLACQYCYYLGTIGTIGKDSISRITDALLENYIRQHFQASNDKIVTFSWHGGEPTLLGIGFFQRIIELQRKYCPKNKTFHNGMQTNGTLISEEWAKFLALNQFSVGISLDGPEKLHDIYRLKVGGEGSFAAAIHGYNQLQKHGVSTEALCVLNSHNVKEPLPLYRFFKEIGVEAISFLPLVERTAKGVSDRSITPDEFGTFLCCVFDEWKTQDIGRMKIQIFEEALRTAFRQDHSLCLFRPVCGDIPVLASNGDLYACDHYVLPEWHIGNINRISLTKLLRTPRLRQFGEEKRGSLTKQCLDCEVLSMCNGECPKNRFVEVAGESSKQNYLCRGYKMFFNHCLPFVEAVSHQWQQTNPTKNSIKPPARNEPCSCGSGRKFKKCCGR